MKSANGIVKSLCEYFDWDLKSEQAKEIAKALEDYAAERVMENRKADERVILSWKTVRSEALEQAAKIAEDGMVDHELWLMENSDKPNLIAQHGFIANKIRQLKDKA